MYSGEAGHLCPAFSGSIARGGWSFRTTKDAGVGPGWPMLVGVLEARSVLLATLLQKICGGVSRHRRSGSELSSLMGAGSAYSVESIAWPFCARSLRRVCFFVGRCTSWSGARRRLSAF